jgi:hypothetical protein
VSGLVQAKQQNFSLLKWKKSSQRIDITNTNILWGRGTDLEQLNHSQEYTCTRFYFQLVQPTYNTRVMKPSKGSFRWCTNVRQNETVDGLNLAPSI